jgi:hypothetical protein
VGITRFTTKVVLTTGTAETSTGAAVAGHPAWIVDYTVTQNGRESSFRVTDYAEAGARRLVANLLEHRQPGLRVEDVYSEQFG